MPFEGESCRQQEREEGDRRYCTDLEGMVGRLQMALSEIGGIAATALAEAGITGFDQGRDDLVGIKDIVDDALAWADAGGGEGR